MRRSPARLQSEGKQSNAYLSFRALQVHREQSKTKFKSRRALPRTHRHF